MPTKTARDYGTHKRRRVAGESLSKQPKSLPADAVWVRGFSKPESQWLSIRGLLSWMTYLPRLMALRDWLLVGQALQTVQGKRHSLPSDLISVTVELSAHRSQYVVRSPG